MSLIQNSRSLTKSCLPFFSKPRNTGNTSDKRNTPNYVIHVIHLIQVFTSSTSNASNTSDASYASNESNASKSSASVGRLSSYLGWVPYWRLREHISWPLLLSGSELNAVPECTCTMKQLFQNNFWPIKSFCGKMFGEVLFHEGKIIWPGWNAWKPEIKRQGEKKSFFTSWDLFGLTWGSLSLRAVLSWFYEMISSP